MSLLHNNLRKKVPYLQYEILELIHTGQDISFISNLTGYPVGSKIIDSAIASLIQKKLLSEKHQITTEALNLINSHYQDRYTHKKCYPEDFSLESQKTLFNAPHNPYHRWYEYLEDFPGDFVKKYSEKYKLDKKYYLFDPFVGSGTTLISGKMLGLKGVGFDINPVMTFISQQKLNWDYDIDLFKEEYEKSIRWFAENNTSNKYFNLTPLSKMPRKEINQWLSPVKQKEIASLYWYIKNRIDMKIRDLFLLVLISASIKVSYVSFCPGTTFYPFRKKPDLISEFCNISRLVYEDLCSRYQRNKTIVCKVYHASSLISNSFKPILNKVDLIITSPPYPNDLEYTRQTRLEMYLLGIAEEMNDIQKIKKAMVKGSTKLIYHNDKPIYEILNNPRIQEIAKKIQQRTQHKNWGFNYPLMVQMYFSDMYRCLKNYYSTVVKGGTVILVVGDQTIQQVLVPVAEILEELSKEIGFKKTLIELHRERRSTGHNLPIPEKNLIMTK